MSLTFGELNNIVTAYRANRGLVRKFMAFLSNGRWGKSADMAALEQQLPDIFDKSRCNAELSQNEINTLIRVLQARYKRIKTSRWFKKTTYTTAPLNPTNMVFWAIAERLCVQRARKDPLAPLQMLTGHFERETVVANWKVSHESGYYYFDDENAHNPKKIFLNDDQAHAVSANDDDFADDLYYDGKRLYRGGNPSARESTQTISHSAQQKGFYITAQSIQERGGFATDDDDIFFLDELIGDGPIVRLPEPYRRGLSEGEVRRILSIARTPGSRVAQMMLQTIETCYREHKPGEISAQSLLAIEHFGHCLDVHHDRGRFMFRIDGITKEKAGVDYEFVKFGDYIANLPDGERKRLNRIPIKSPGSTNIPIGYFMVYPGIEKFFYDDETAVDPLKQAIDAVVEKLQLRIVTEPHGGLSITTNSPLAKNHKDGWGTPVPQDDNTIKITPEELQYLMRNYNNKVSRNGRLTRCIYLNTECYNTLRDCFLSFVVRRSDDRNYSEHERETPCNEAGGTVVRALAEHLHRRQPLIRRFSSPLVKFLLLKVFFDANAISNGQIDALDPMHGSVSLGVDINLNNLSLLKLLNPLRWVEFACTLCLESIHRFFLNRGIIMKHIVFPIVFGMALVVLASLIMSGIYSVIAIGLGCFLNAYSCIYSISLGKRLQKFHDYYLPKYITRPIKHLVNGSKNIILSWVKMFTSPIENVIWPALTIVQRSPWRFTACVGIFVPVVMVTVFMNGFGVVPIHALISTIGLLGSGGVAMAFEKLLIGLVVAGAVLVPVLSLAGNKPARVFPEMGHRHDYVPVYRPVDGSSNRKIELADECKESEELLYDDTAQQTVRLRRCSLSRLD